MGKVRKNNSRKMFRLIVFVSFLVVMFAFSVGYAAVTITGNVQGKAVVKKHDDTLKITSVIMNNSKQGATEKFSPTYDAMKINFGINLPQLGSGMAYFVTITNNSTTSKTFRRFSDIVSTNSDIVYTIGTLTDGYVLAAGTSVKVKVNFAYRAGLTQVPSSTDLGLLLRFDFE